ncbi:MAG: hypothetical protein UW73_C0037G0008 [Microgenomates group bacterium GW2011_GWB1_44_8]|nr:MAG: hypothetical protein UW73_C0037G0008 [Microgenomates group bacterium GW2011_GWB1_44_8]
MSIGLEEVTASSETSTGLGSALSFPAGVAVWAGGVVDGAGGMNIVYSWESNYEQLRGYWGV